MMTRILLIVYKSNVFFRPVHPLFVMKICVRDDVRSFLWVFSFFFFFFVVLTSPSVCPTVKCMEVTFDSKEQNDVSTVLKDLVVCCDAIALLHRMLYFLCVIFLERPTNGKQ